MNDIANVEQPQQQGLMIFGSGSPEGIINRASGIASALAPLIEKKKMYVNVGGRKHVYVEGWNTMLAMLGIFPECEYSRKIGDAPLAYESRVILRHVSGVQVGAGEALCTADEKNWSAKDEFQLKSMAQTRATGKAARLSFSWIMGLAGYEATPAEEVAGEVVKSEPIRGPEASKPPAAAASTDGEAITIIPLRVSSKATKTGGMSYSVQLPDGGWASSFDENVGALLSDAKAGGKKVALTLVQKGEYKNIATAELV